VDVARLAQFHGIPFVPPRPDPIVQDIATRRIADEQPYIFRLTRMGQAASRRGKSLAFADEVSRLIWGGTQGWHEGDHLAGAAARAGLDLPNSKPKPRDADRLDAELAANQEALEAAGHWGVPTLVFDGEPFFGQDRIDLAVWRMEQKGLTRDSRATLANDSAMTGGCQCGRIRCRRRQRRGLSLPLPDVPEGDRRSGRAFVQVAPDAVAWEREPDRYASSRSRGVRSVGCGTPLGFALSMAPA
jgi:2-hydroxychromene-2-carboxylate isomerase